jgi:hypothetical protein
MKNPTLTITFPGATKAEANRYAQSLADDLTAQVSNLESAEPIRDNEDAQDFGATLVLVLGTAAATEVARGIRSWLSRHGSVASLSKDGTVILENIESKDVASIANALSKHQ